MTKTTNSSICDQTIKTACHVLHNKVLEVGKDGTSKQNTVLYSSVPWNCVPLSKLISNPAPIRYWTSLREPLIKFNSYSPKTTLISSLRCQFMIMYVPQLLWLGYVRKATQLELTSQLFTARIRQPFTNHITVDHRPLNISWYKFMANSKYWR